jgi:hypothetical protein
VAITTNTRARGTSAGSGRTVQSAAVARIQTREKPISHGRRRPVRSAIAPSTGLSTAIHTAAMAVALPHRKVPSVSLGATPLVK